MSWVLDIFFCRAGCIVSLALRLAGVQTCLSCPHFSGQMIRRLWLSKSRIFLFGKLLLGIFLLCLVLENWSFVKLLSSDGEMRLDQVFLAWHCGISFSVWRSSRTSFTQEGRSSASHRASTCNRTVLWRLSVGWLLGLELASLWRSEFVGRCVLALKSRCFSRCPSSNRLCWGCFCVLVGCLVWLSNSIHWHRSEMIGRALLKFRSVRAHSGHCGWHKRTWRVMGAMLLVSELIAGWITDSLFSRNGNGWSQVIVGAWSRLGSKLLTFVLPFSPFIFLSVFIFPKGIVVLLLLKTLKLSVIFSLDIGRKPLFWSIIS